MRENFEEAFSLTIGLEGKPSNDPNDPGGFTIWGLAKKYHPEITISTTIDYAKKVYLNDYWIPAGCNNYKYPLDICVFDSAVNPQNDPKIPGVGNIELLSQNPENWQDYQILRMNRYRKNSKREFVLGHINRVLILSETLRNNLKNKEK